MEWWTLFLAAAAAVGTWWQIWHAHAHRPMALWEISTSSEDGRTHHFSLRSVGDTAVYKLHVRGDGCGDQYVSLGRYAPGDGWLELDLTVDDGTEPGKARMVMSWMTHSPRRGRTHWLRTNLGTGRRERYERRWLRRHWVAVDRKLPQEHP